MAGKGSKKAVQTARTDEYVHEKAQRLNNPEAGLHSADKKVPTRVKYAFDPHLDPQLVWASKAERTELEVETVSLHKHEIVRPQDMLSMLQAEPAQLGFFADQRLPIHKAVEFYKHDQHWMNRLVLGDSLLVMNSLLHKENLGGQVQMIYIDPPYGISYNSNFQPRINSREVQDGKDESLSREPEQIKAYRDTWTLGIHSYLSYLRDRLALARELLSASGSIFVQISDDNVHHVRELLDEIFGAGNCVSQISFAKTTSATVKWLPSTTDYILWYARDLEKLKYRSLFSEKEGGDAGAGVYSLLRFPDGTTRRMSPAERRDTASITGNPRIFRIDNLTSQSIGREKGEGAACWFPVELDGKKYYPNGQRRWTTNEEGMQRLIAAGRVVPAGITLGYVRYLDDFPYRPANNLWTDTGTGSFTDEKTYVVQTGTKVIQRCILMTTDPGSVGCSKAGFEPPRLGWISADRPPSTTDLIAHL